MAPWNSWAQAARDFFSRGVLTQPFGPSSVGLEPAFGGAAHFHEGVDLAYPEGTAVLSPVGYAKVVSVRRSSTGYGNSVIIATQRGVRILFGHLRSINVREGDAIALGEAIGEVGCSGASVGQTPCAGGRSGVVGQSGPHLHLEIRDERGRLIPPGAATNQSVLTKLSNLFGWQRPYSGQEGFEGSAAGYWTQAGGYSGPPTGINYQAGTDYQGEPGGPGPAPTPEGEPQPLPDPGDSRPPADCQWWDLPCQASRGASGVLDLRGMGRDLRNWFINNVSVPLLWISIGGILIIAGVRQLGKEGPVQVVTQPIRDVAGAAGGVAKKAVGVAAR